MRKDRPRNLYNQRVNRTRKAAPVTLIVGRRPSVASKKMKNDGLCVINRKRGRL